METNFTFKTYSFLALIFILALSLNLKGQTTYNVSATSSVFTPSQLTITAGDKVVWNNNAGSHNVNGNKSTFPNNPASFGNNVGSGWTYEFVFNTAGTYDYQCDVHANMGMAGKIVVNPKVTTSSQILADGAEKMFLYPNPATNSIELFVPDNSGQIISLKVYTISGELSNQEVFSTDSGSLRFDISQFKNGIYFMEVSAGNERNVIKFIKQ